MNGPDLAWVGLAGGVGAVTRFAVDSLVRSRVPGPLPLGTISINISGSLLLGLLTGLAMFHGAPPTLTLVAGTGFCGGYTTFSTASFETVRLVQQGLLREAVVTGGITLGGALVAAALGLALAAL